MFFYSNMVKQTWIIVLFSHTYCTKTVNAIHAKSKNYLFWLDGEKSRPTLSFMNVDVGKQFFDWERKIFHLKIQLLLWKQSGYPWQILHFGNMSPAEDCVQVGRDQAAKPGASFIKFHWGALNCGDPYPVLLKVDLHLNPIPNMIKIKMFNDLFLPWTPSFWG